MTVKFPPAASQCVKAVCTEPDRSGKLVAGQIYDVQPASIGGYLSVSLDGVPLGEWFDTRFDNVAPGPASYVLLASESGTCLSEQRHADLAAAIQWLQEKNLQGSFRVLHVTEGELLTATRETKTTVQVNA
ncbi:hypothetical protein R6138_04568 [Ralstonia thomasii]|uniref:hypothetical protein n=1 Tax=Ralstonia thomasii TaxID=3058596 RepID=UPI0028F5FA44|nr:hypothetical protein [Ralstonia sp. LMG 18095]CAJ0901344.1 hypothetical protein R6138_04568 [Ralstonia sp. LMG 18095]